MPLEHIRSEVGRPLIKNPLEKGPRIDATYAKKMSSLSLADYASPAHQVDCIIRNGSSIYPLEHEA